VNIPTIAIIVVAWVVVFGLASAWIAARRDRVRAIWFGYGAILGPVALVLVWLAPRGYCPVCLTPGRGWLTTCWWCGSSLGGSSTRRPRPAPTDATDATVLTDRTPSALWPAPVTQPAPPMQSEPVGVMDPAITSDARPAKRRRRRRDAAAEEPAGTVDDATMAGALEASRDMPPGAPAVLEPGAEHRSRATSSSGAIRVEPTPLAGGTAAASERPDRGPTIQPDTPAAIASAPATSRPPSPGEPGMTPPRPAEPILIATAVYFAGSPRLEIGARYGLIIEGSRFKIVGPYDPSVVAFERPLAGLAATVNLGRVLLAFPDGRGSIALVFTALAGATPQKVVETLLKAAEQARE
jgi:hypothetical protein